MKRLRIASTVLAAVVLVAGCRADDGHNEAQGGPTRPFQMGISTLPRDLNADAYAEAFDLASTAGDIVLIQKAVPWEDLLADGVVGAEAAETTAAELHALGEHDLDLFFAIDPTDGTTGRDRIGGLPQSYQGRGFDDADIRRAFAVYAEYVAVNYRPRYLALGVEMNLYYHHQPGDFEAFTSLYDETYRRVKDVSPNTLVTVTFQYEDLQAELPTTEPHFTDWQLLALYEPLVDVTAISTYPSFAFGRVDEIPADYYTQLGAFTEHPVVVADAGFSSGPLDLQAAVTTGEREQADFVIRLLRDAEAMRMPSVVWFAGWDPSYAAGTALSAYQYIGLLRTDGIEKPAWRDWMDVAQRPFGDSSH